MISWEVQFLETKVDEAESVFWGSMTTRGSLTGFDK